MRIKVLASHHRGSAAAASAILMLFRCRLSQHPVGSHDDRRTLDGNRRGGGRGQAAAVPPAAAPALPAPPEPVETGQGESFGPHPQVSVAASSGSSGSPAADFFVVGRRDGDAAGEGGVGDDGVATSAGHASAMVSGSRCSTSAASSNDYSGIANGFSGFCPEGFFGENGGFAAVEVDDRSRVFALATDVERVVLVNHQTPDAPVVLETPHFLVKTHVVNRN